MRVLIPFLMLAAVALAAPRVDNVLVSMVPPGSTSLVGAHMDQLEASDLYEKLMAKQKLPQLDQFARDTGFDPRRDVREILMVSGPSGTVALARGKFNLKRDAAAGTRLVRHGQYNIRTDSSGATAGFCILDSSLAAAGDIPAIEAALDEWQRGTHKAAQPLLTTVGALSDSTPLWGVSTGFAVFLANNIPKAGNGVDFVSIFHGIETSWFDVSVSSGFNGAIHCTTATEKAATGLRDGAKGLIGLGRLSVPENKPDLMRFWDGFHVEQSGRSFTLSADVAGDLLDQMVQMLSGPGNGRGRGPRAATGRFL